MHAEFERLFRESGYRWTAPRRAVTRALARSGGHVYPERLWQEGRRFCPRLGRATVYRTLDVLTGLGILRPVVSASGGHVYAVAMGGHHHLVCSSCGTMVDFDGAGGCPGWERVARRHGFTLAGHLLELYGMCGDCREAGEKGRPL